MRIYKLSYSKPGADLQDYKYIVLSAESEGDAREKAKAEIKQVVNIYGCKEIQ